MASITTLLTGILAIFAFWLGNTLFDSFIVAMMFLVIAVITGKTLQPVILTLWYKFMDRYFPLPDVHPLYSKGLENPDTPVKEGDAPPKMLGMKAWTARRTKPHTRKLWKSPSPSCARNLSCSICATMPFCAGNPPLNGYGSTAAKKAKI